MAPHLRAFTCLVAVSSNPHNNNIGRPLVHALLMVQTQKGSQPAQDQSLAKDGAEMQSPVCRTSRDTWTTSRDTWTTSRTCLFSGTKRSSYLCHFSEFLNNSVFPKGTTSPTRCYRQGREKHFSGVFLSSQKYFFHIVTKSYSTAVGPHCYKQSTKHQYPRVSGGQPL